MNKDIKTRDQIIFGAYEPDKYMGGVRNFRGLTVEILEDLVNQDFLELDSCQNFSPTAREFIDFLSLKEEKCNGGYTAHGYAVIDTRDDYRITIEGIEKIGHFGIDEIIEFTEMFRCADEFNIELNAGQQSLYCWYD